MTVLDEVFLSPQENRRSYGSLCLSNLNEFLNRKIHEEQKHFQHTKDKESDGVSGGRLGADKVVLDIRDKTGTAQFSDDKFSLTSHCNFFSIRGNVCVFAGKWQYEVLLGSKGVMQLGWCTRSCKFSQEEGVGDTVSSFAYCGNRQLKWNSTVGEEYGEMWMAGDIISCTIDCDQGSVAFYRNGQSMGDAYTDIKLGPGMAYFPGLSLSLAEHVTVNFGGTPLRYPVPGFMPLQAAPGHLVHKASILCGYLDNLVEYYSQSHSDPSTLASRMDLQLSIQPHIGPTSPVQSRECISDRAKLLLIGSHIFQHLGPLLKNCYVVESCLVPLVLKRCEVEKWTKSPHKVTVLLDLLSGLLQEHEYQVCIEQLMVSLMTHYRYSPCHMGYVFQKRHLCAILTLLRHTTTRKHLLEHVLFRKAKFPLIMHIRPPEEATLEEIVPIVWWDKEIKTGLQKSDSPKAPLSPEEAQCKEAYTNSCLNFGHQLKDLEDMQCEMIKVLMSDEDGGRLSSRQLFLEKLRGFIKENVFDLGVCEYPWPVGLCFFHRLVRVCRELWDEQHSLCTDGSVPRSEDAFISLERFYNGSIKYFEAGRLGGLLSHLKKEHKDLLQDESPGNLAGNAAKDSDVEQAVEVKCDEDCGAASGPALKSTVSDLQELLDSLSWLYCNSGHKQIAKLATIRESVHDQERLLRDLRSKLQKCPDDLTSVRKELERSKVVFEKVMTKQARQMSWLIGVVFTKEKRDDVYWLHKVLLRTFELASNQGPLFAFLPEFYMTNTVQTYNAIRSHFNPTVSYFNIEDHQETLQKYSLFLINHYSDPRIVSANSKDAMVQALAAYVCFPDTLKSLESVDPLNRMQLVKALVIPYEDRSWVQSNWILLRFWKGSGWAYRYKLAPHLAHIKELVVDAFGGVSLQEPCPSEVFQKHVSEYLHQNPELATKFVDSLLNQLNWSFSEFIGMLQELQSLAMRMTSAMIDGRQLKICATCFDIAVALLRVVEMTASLAPEVYLDFDRPSAELLLCRLCQSLCQIMNRVLSKSQSLFEMVVSAHIPNFETVDHFPIVSALVGTMVQLLHHSDPLGKERATLAMLSEPSFQISCLELLVDYDGDKESGAEAAAQVKDRQDDFKLGFKNYPEEVSQDEVEQVESMISHLKKEKTLMRSISEELDEETVCNICYASKKSVVFFPCGHLSCKACIAHHMMIKKECFFCKAKIDRVESITEGTPV